MYISTNLELCPSGHTHTCLLFINGTYRMQAQPANSEDPYRGMTDCFRRTLRREGISGFYKGLVPNLLKVVPSASITYLVYETMKKNLSLD